MSSYFNQQPLMYRADEKRIKALSPASSLYPPKPSKKPSSVSDTTMAPAAFPKFLDLPYELRDMIWEFAAISLPPRTIELRTIPINNPGRLEYYSQRIDPLAAMPLPREPRFTLTFGSPTLPPSLLSVSQHARKVVKRHYELAFRPINSELLDPKREPHRTVLNSRKVRCPNCTCCTHGIWCDFEKDIFVAGRGVFLNEKPQEEWMDDSEKDLYGRHVFPESRMSIQKIQILALPIRALWTRNTVTWHLGFLTGLKKILLLRTRGFDKKPYVLLKGREIEEDAQCPEGKDEDVFMARIRGYRTLKYFMMVKEARAMAGMMYALQRLRLQDQWWNGPDGIQIWTATVKKRPGDSAFKRRAKKVWATVSGKGLKK